MSHQMRQAACTRQPPFGAAAAAVRAAANGASTATATAASAPGTASGTPSGAAAFGAAAGIDVDAAAGRGFSQQGRCFCAAHRPWAKGERWLPLHALPDLAAEKRGLHAQQQHTQHSTGRQHPIESAQAMKNKCGSNERRSVDDPCAQWCGKAWKVFALQKGMWAAAATKLKTGLPREREGIPSNEKTKNSEFFDDKVVCDRVRVHCDTAGLIAHPDGAVRLCGIGAHG